MYSFSHAREFECLISIFVWGEAGTVLRLQHWCWLGMLPQLPSAAEAAAAQAWSNSAMAIFCLLTCFLFILIHLHGALSTERTRTKKLNLNIPFVLCLARLCCYLDSMSV